MPRLYRFWSWLVFSLSTGAYLPIAVGAWNHPIELNLASYSIWMILSALITYAAIKQKMPGWRMMLGWAVGNASMVLLGLVRGGCAFNMGPAETVVVYGIIITLAAWAAIGSITKRWSPRILFWGSVAADIFSFYPQIKQYLVPHERPTYWMLVGWLMWAVASTLNIAFVDRLVQKLRVESTRTWLVVEASAISVENAVLMIVTIAVMFR